MHRTLPLEAIVLAALFFLACADRIEAPESGSLELSVEWDAAAFPRPTVAASLLPPVGHEQELPLTVGSGSAKATVSGLSSGTFVLLVQLSEEGTLESGVLDCVDIAANETVSCRCQCPYPGEGKLKVRIVPQPADPLVVRIAGVAPTMRQGSLATAVASVAGTSRNVVFVWYLNGVAQATGRRWSFGQDLPVAAYSVGVTAFTADGKRAGSATADLEVTE